MTYLSPEQLGRVRQLLPLYLEGQRRVGVPWALLAALHYRESDLGDRTDRVGGPLQFDPPLTLDQVRRIGATYQIPDLLNPETDLRTALLCAAAFLQGKAAALAKVLRPDSPLEEVADVAWSYNGRAYGDWQHSPYVSNDPQHGVQLRITGTVPDVNDPRKRVRIDRLETRPGVLPIIRELLARVMLPSPPAPAPVAPGPSLGRVLLADKSGKFGIAPEGDFVYRSLFYSRKPNGDLWIRPATPEELARTQEGS